MAESEFNLGDPAARHRRIGTFAWAYCRAAGDLACDPSQLEQAENSLRRLRDAIAAEERVQARIAAAPQKEATPTLVDRDDGWRGELNEVRVKLDAVDEAQAAGHIAQQEQIRDLRERLDSYGLLLEGLDSSRARMLAQSDIQKGRIAALEEGRPPPSSLAELNSQRNADADLVRENARLQERVAELERERKETNAQVEALLQQAADEPRAD